MEPVKNFTSLTLLGGLLGGLITGWASPRMITWYFTPPVDIISCAPATEWAMGRLILLETIGVIAGAVFVVVLYIFFGKKKRNTDLSFRS